jgi:hypothetical protein
MISNNHTITTMPGPNTSILILIFALYVFFPGNVLIAFRGRRCTIYFGIGICLILIFFHVFLTFWWCIAITHNPYSIFSFHWKDSSVIFLFYNFGGNYFSIRDYVTEKLFRLYNTNFNIIPVVRGAPNVKELLPPNTFISTLDYKSPADLAKHLKEIVSSEVAYTDRNNFSVT